MEWREYFPRLLKPQLILAMKLVTILLLAGFMHVSASGNSQVVTLNEKNAKLEIIFEKIFVQTGVEFFYNSAVLERAKPVSIKITGGTLNDVLAICLADQNLEFVINGKTVTIREKQSLNALRQNVRGQVVTENGEPVPGATVTVKGSTTSTNCDEQGLFDIAGVTINSELRVTGAEIESTDIKIGAREFLIIRVKRKENELDKVVLIAYGTTTRRLNTGSVGKVSKEVIGNQPISNPLAALPGRVTGLNISQNTGVPGGSYSVEIRGRNSISSGSEPLYIIDGVPFLTRTLGSSTVNNSILDAPSPLNTLNPGDIESIEVLKDADATAIYGSRGSNGVILISTKKGKEGKTNVNLNLYSGFGTLTRKIDLLSGPEYLEMRREAFSNDNIIPNSSTPRSIDLFVWDTTTFIDWQKELIGGTAGYSNAEISISGGSAETQFLFSTSYHRESTVFDGNFSDRKATFFLNVNHRSTNQKLNLSVSANYLYNSNNLPSADPTASISAAPNAVFRDIDGNLVFHSGISNPYVISKQTYHSGTNGLIANGSLGYQLIKNVILKITAGFTRMERDEKQLNPLDSYNPANGMLSGDSYFAQNTVNSWIVEPQLGWDKKSGRHNLNILTGGTLQNDFNDGRSFYASGFQSDALLENIQSAGSVTVLSNTYDKYRYLAVFGRVRYSFADKYISEITGRSDGSSRFGPDKQFASFGAVGIAWVFGREKFFQRSLTALSFGKLRMSFGSTGNDQIGNYQYFDSWSTVPFSYGSVSGLYPTRIANDDYAWERNRKKEAGIDLGFFKDRVLLSAGYYLNRSDNLLVGFSIPPSTGFTTIQNNLPAIVQNKGWEFELSFQNFIKSNFKWSGSFNISLPRNKLLAYPGIESSAYATTYKVGEPLSVLYAYRFNGVNRETGVYEYEDVNKDGQITFPEDLQTFRGAQTDYYGGLQNKFVINRLSIDIFFQFVKQTNHNYYGSYVFPGYISNQPADVIERWRNSGDEKPVQKFTQSFSSPAFQAYNNFIRSSDRVISDGSFIRLRNVSISCDFPTSLLHKFGARRLSIYLQGQNLITITRFIGLDPELRSVSNLPPLRVIVFGIQVNF